MSAASRSKGRRGQQQAGDLLRSRDWRVIEVNAGTAVEDFIAIDPQDRTWCCEVKNCKSITEPHRKQAIEQAKKRRLPWMLVSHITGTASWLIQRQGEDAVVWKQTQGEQG